MPDLVGNPTCWFSHSAAQIFTKLQHSVIRKCGRKVVEIHSVKSIEMAMCVSQA